MAVKITKTVRRYWHLGPDYLRYVRSRKRLVLVHSAMRAGSTMLNALLAMARDVSHLPEVHFRTFNARNKWHFFNHFSAISEDPIVVLKHPVWYTRRRADWHPPALHRLHNVLLVRDCHASCLSLNNMPRNVSAASIVKYWHATNRTLLDIAQQAPDRWLIVRYEDLTARPMEETARIFRFIGSIRSSGAAHYKPPQSFKWQWRQGDGGDRIGSLIVAAAPPTGYDPVFSPLIERSEEVQHVRALLKYTN